MFAKDIVVYGGSAEYKGQVGGGVYDLVKVEYYNGTNGAFMLRLFFDKKSKFISQEQEIMITGRIMNARQIVIDGDDGPQGYNIEGCKGSTVALDRFFARIDLKGVYITAKSAYQIFYEPKRHFRQSIDSLKHLFQH